MRPSRGYETALVHERNYLGSVLIILIGKETEQRFLTARISDARKYASLNKKIEHAVKMTQFRGKVGSTVDCRNVLQFCLDGFDTGCVSAGLVHARPA